MKLKELKKEEMKGCVPKKKVYNITDEQDVFTHEMREGFNQCRSQILKEINKL